MRPRALPPCRSWRGPAVALLVGLSLAAVRVLGDDRPRPVAPAPRPVEPAGKAAEARALFEAYCLDCHSGGRPSGSFALDELLDARGADANRGRWEKVWKIVRHEF